MLGYRCCNLRYINSVIITGSSGDLWFTMSSYIARLRAVIIRSIPSENMFSLRFAILSKDSTGYLKYASLLILCMYFICTQIVARLLEKIVIEELPSLLLLLLLIICLHCDRIITSLYI